MIEALSFLKTNNLLPSDNYLRKKPDFVDLNIMINLVAKQSDGQNVLKALYDLENNKILNRVNVKLVARHAHPDSMAQALHMLKFDDLNNDIDYIDLVAKHAKPSDMATALLILDDQKILTPESAALVDKHANPEQLAWTFSELKKNMYSAMRDAVAGLEKPKGVSRFGDTF